MPSLGKSDALTTRLTPLNGGVDTTIINNVNPTRGPLPGSSRSELAESKPSQFIGLIAFIYSTPPDTNGHVEEDTSQTSL